VGGAALLLGWAALLLGGPASVGPVGAAARLS
jgi:hypothetical protein